MFHQSFFFRQFIVNANNMKLSENDGVHEINEKHKTAISKSKSKSGNQAEPSQVNPMIIIIGNLSSLSYYFFWWWWWWFLFVLVLVLGFSSSSLFCLAFLFAIGEDESHHLDISLQALYNILFNRQID